MTSDPNSPPPPPPTPPHPASTGPASSRPPVDEFFDRIRSWGAIRPSEGRWISGVAAALARRWDIDEILVRGVFVALTVLGGIGALAYGVAWLLLPQEDGRIHLQQAIRGDITAGFIGAVILALAGVGSGGPWHAGPWFGWGPGGLILTVLIVAGIWWLARGANRSWVGFDSTWIGFKPTGQTPTGQTTTEQATTGQTTTYGTPTAGYGTPPGYRMPPGSPPTPPAPPAPRRGPDRAKASKSLTRLTLGLALLAAAAVFIAGHQGHWLHAPVVLIASAAALVIIAVGVIASGLGGRRSGGLAVIGFLLAIFTLAGAGADNAGVRAGQNVALVGEHTWRPMTAQAANAQFNLGVGEATLWLTAPGLLHGASAADPTHVSARIGAGHLVVMLPGDVPAQVKVEMGAGELVNPNGDTQQIDRNHSASSVQTVHTGPAGAPQLTVEVQQGVGQLEIRTTGSTPSPIPPSPSAIPSPSPVPSPSAASTK